MKDKLKYYYMNAAEQLDSIIDIYKKSIGAQIGFSAIVNIVFSIVAFIFIFTGTFMLAFSLASNISLDNLNASTIVSIAIFVFFILVIVAIRAAIYSPGNVIMALKGYLGEKINLSQVIKQSFKSFLHTFTCLIAQLIVMIPIIIVSSLAIFLYLYFCYKSTYSFYSLYKNDVNAFITVYIIVTIVFVLFIMAISIVAQTIVLVSIPVAVFEKKYFFSAFIKNFELIRKDFAKICCLVAVYTLIVYVASYSFTALSGIGKLLAEMFLPRNISASYLVASVYLDQIISMIVTLILGPLSGIFSTVVYINQKIKYEGLDIELKIIDLQKEQRHKEYLEYQEAQRKQQEEYQKTYMNMKNNYNNQGF